MTERKKAGCLTGWDEIGKFLDCDASTAKRWHKIRKMPIYRAVPGGSLKAFPEDLNKWLKAK